MQIEIFTLADAATDSQGKLNILGTFDTIFTKKIPVIWPLLTVVAKIRAFPGEENKHNMTVRFVDATGKDFVTPLNAEINFVFQPHAKFTSANFILSLQNLQFKEYGQYSVTIDVEGKQMMTIPLLVTKPLGAQDKAK